MEELRKKGISKWTMVGILIIVIAVASAITYYLTLLTLPKAPEEVLPETIKIGFVCPLTGPAAPTGFEMKYGAMYAVQDINAKGGILGRKVELIIEDTGGDPKMAVAAVEKLITRDKVVAIAGEVHSSCALAEIPIVERYGIPFVVASAWADSITAAGYKYVFRVGPVNSHLIEYIGDFAVKSGFKKWGIIYEDTDWGFDMLRTAKKFATEHGITVKEVMVSRTAMEYYSELMVIKDFNPDFILSITFGKHTLALVKQAYELGITPKVLYYCAAGAELFYPEWWPTVDKAGEYVLGQVVVHEYKINYTDITASLRERFLKETGRKSTHQLYLSYDAVMAICEAIKQARSVKPDAIVEALETKVDIPGAAAPRIKFEKEVGTWKWHQRPVTYLIVQYLPVTRKLVVVYPEKYAESPLVKPP
jgi:branched-chain amino acid transport system substrate-binding protein